MRTRRSYGLGAMLFLVACGGTEVPTEPDGDDGPEAPPIPSPGPHFSVLPLDLDSLVRISPLGLNNKIFPVGHTYWSTCDQGGWILPTEDPCYRTRPWLRAPGSGVVIALNAVDDGDVSVEGPPGVRWTFGHVTPVAGLRVGDSVQAGDTIARMFSEFNFDFGLVHLGLEPHRWVNMERVFPAYEYAHNPVDQFPEPLRSQLRALVPTFEDPTGRLSYDVEGTAQGNWFLEGTAPEISFRVDQTHRQLFLGRAQERYDLRIMIPGWEAPPWGRIVIDPDGLAWDEITPSSGLVSLKAWNMNRDVTPNYDYAMGTVLLEMLAADRLRIEWFDTHDDVPGFTDGARVYER